MAKDIPMTTPDAQPATITYTVWSLDVWGHASDECEETCETCKGDPGEDDERCLTCNGTGRHCDGCGDFVVNDRSRCGTIEVPAGATDNAILDALLSSVYLSRADRMVAEIDENYTGDVDDNGIPDMHYVNNSTNGRPLFELEREGES